MNRQFGQFFLELFFFFCCFVLKLCILFSYVLIFKLGNFIQKENAINSILDT